MSRGWSQEHRSENRAIRVWLLEALYRVKSGNLVYTVRIKGKSYQDSRKPCVITQLPPLLPLRMCCPLHLQLTASFSVCTILRLSASINLSRPAFPLPASHCLHSSCPSFDVLRPRPIVIVLPTRELLEFSLHNCVCSQSAPQTSSFVSLMSAQERGQESRE